MIRFQCESCGKRMKVADKLAGRKGRCPRCGHELLVPNPAQTKPIPAATSHRLLPAVSKVHDDEEMIDMTAMVDIVFFLLIFFMVTSLGAHQASIAMPKPTGSAAAPGKAASKRTVEDFEAEADYLIVRIDADDTVWVEDAEAMTPSDVHQKLREAIERMNTGSEEPHVLILGDGLAHHGTAVMVLDAARDVGANDVRFAVTEGDVDIE